MKKLGLMLIVCTFVILNPVTAQSNSVSIDCSSSQDNTALQPGGEGSCLVEGFPSSFNWNNYSYDWSISEGEILQKSVESINFQVPYNTSTNDIVLEVDISDASGEAYSGKTSVKLETKDESEETENDSNQSYQLPVEDPEENSSYEQPALSDFKLTCSNSVTAGHRIDCSVSYNSNNQGETYEWNVEGDGQVKGNEKSGVYTAPERVEDIDKVQIRFTQFSSSDSVSDSEVVKVSAPENSDQKRGENNQSIETYQERVQEQRKTIQDQRKTITHLKETIEDLRQEINEKEEKESDKQFENKTEDQTEKKTSGDSIKTNKSSINSSEDSENRRGDNSEPVQRNSEKEDRVKESNSGNNSDEKIKKKERRSLIETFKSIFS